MKDFCKLYVRVFTGYWSDCKDAGEAAKEFGWCILSLTLPLTFPVLYPMVRLYQKVMKK